MEKLESYTLTTTWNPRGELARLRRLMPRIGDVFDHIVVILPPVTLIAETDRQAIVEVFNLPGLRVFHTEVWAAGRHTALLRALDTQAAFIQYADMDRLLRWAEVRLDEWLRVTERVTRCDCLIVGRSRSAYQTHPQALVQTEQISNTVASHFLSRQMDVSAGCKGFSRRAAEYLITKTTQPPALGTDAEWPLLLHRGGYPIDYIEVDGLEWESADRYQDQAADPCSQREQAEAYDADPQHWVQRVQVASEIVAAALDVDAMSL